MGPTYVILTERPIDDFDRFGQGEAIAAVSDLLDELAEAACVPTLMDFFSMSPEESSDLFKGLDLEIPPGEEDPRDEPDEPEAWYDAKDGLETVNALIEAVESRPKPDEPDPLEPPDEAILAELREFAIILDHLDAADIRWHLGIEF